MSSTATSGAPPVVAIFGPTGSGKTDIAVRIARDLGTEVINCDPQQCYRGLPILTNQPGPEHDAIAPHRLIDCWGLDHEANVADFATLAHAEVDALIASAGHAVLCSGSGLYLLAAITELALAGGVGADPAIRARLEEELEQVGPEAMHMRLAGIDAVAASRIHPNDRKRVVRALEVAELSGAGSSVTTGTMWDAPLRRETAIIGLRVDRALVHQRIDERTQRMFDGGLLDEVAAACGVDGSGMASLSTTAQRIHGLQDCVGVLSGEITREEGIRRQAARTRQYAKRQDTWARRWPNLQALDVDPAVDLDAVGRLATDLAAQAPARAHGMREQQQ